MKPFDPRLLRHARAARSVFLIGGVLGLIRTLAILAWSWFLAHTITVVALPALAGAGGGAGRIAEGAYAREELSLLVGGGAGRIAEGAYAREELSLLVGGAAIALIARSLAAWGMDTVAARGAVRVKSQLRAAALAAIDGRSPQRGDGRSDAELATVLGRGLDALDGYFAGYVPQLILTAVATPILILAVLLADPVSGITVLIVFPIIPIFMILIGMATQSVQDRQWAQLQHLATSFLDAVSGLATLKIFRREDRQTARISRATNEYRSRTMKVLRVTFLSGFVLDLAGTFSIALVAVTVGTRMVNGEFPLGLGLFVLLLLPEVFIPIRQVGAAFHASTEGLSASADVFALIEGEGEGGVAGQGAGAGVSEGVGTSVIGASGALELSQLRVARDGRTVVGPVDLRVAPGEVVALAGPSGAGKSTLLAAFLGFVAPAAGHLTRPRQLAWVGQRPGLLQGTVADNVALGAPEPADRDLVQRALTAAALPRLDPERELGATGTGVSGGQAQRIAIARALYRAWTLGPDTALLLDEPTSALDRETEREICATLRREAEAGRAVLVVSHRTDVLDAADRVVRITPATIDEKKELAR
ncbi:thiol reductant ABC exporter subunit CydD [Leucobacter chromiireducens]|uniref:thiol reductant ABC exporter subunit CydD n=1 Tax=Leucobacter chromiireducens TaxID=283877 RepID=UPI000F641B5E|nr:thiol reductant ABC exporter subunit CydD [Leucobacter chromiireducens]